MPEITDPSLLQQLEGGGGPAPVTDPDLLRQLEGPSTTADVAKSFGVGVPKGLIGIAGLPGDIAEYGARGINAAVQGIGNYFGLDVGPSREAQAPTYGSSDIRKGVENVTGPLYEPQTTAGQYAQTVGEFLPAAVTGPGGIARRAITGAVIPGVASEAAGQATQGTWAEPYARVGAAIAAPAAATRLATPFAAGGQSAERAAAVGALEGEGVQLTAGQRTGSKPLQYLESSLGDVTGAGTAAVERGKEQFTRAALRRAGIDAERATPEVIDQAFTRIGNEFDRLAARNTIAPDARMNTELRSAIADYDNIVAPPNRAPIIRNFEEEIAQHVTANNGTIPGTAYQSMRSRLEAAARGAPYEVANTLRDMKSALDDAMQRSMAAARSPDLGAWQRVRREYRNIIPLERAATSAGADTATGLISPSQLRTAVVSQGRRGYARGHGDFADLVRSGEAVMKPLPQSGTAPRAYMLSLPASLGTLGAGLVTGNPMLAGAGAFGALAPPIAGRALMSRPAQAYLGNQALPQAAFSFPNVAPPSIAALEYQR